MEIFIYARVRNYDRAVSFEIVNCSKSNCLLVAAKLDGVKTYMRMRRVPNHLQVKVIKWFDYLWLTQKCSDEEKAVSCLPGKSIVRFIYFGNCSVRNFNKQRISLPRKKNK